MQVYLKYRTIEFGSPPRPIKMAVPGWGGKLEHRVDGSVPQPWHCQSFVDGATFGVELRFPGDSEYSIEMEAGKVNIFRDGKLVPEESSFGSYRCLFSSLAPNYYSMDTLVDIWPPEGFVIRIESHPSFYSDRNDTVPIVVPGHIEHFWPRRLFVVFKTPKEGGKHIFLPGKPYAQIISFQSSISHHLISMTLEEQKKRESLDKRLSELPWLVARHIWYSSTGIWFDDKYKYLRRLFRATGSAGMDKEIDPK